MIWLFITCILFLWVIVFSYERQLERWKIYYANLYKKYIKYIENSYIKK